MANTKNLKPFPKGTSGNPSGRPKTAHISQALRAALEKGAADELASVLLAIATGRKKGTAVQIAAIREIADRTEGRAPMFEPRNELPRSALLQLAVADWDRLNRGESLLDESESKLEKRG